LSFSSFSSRNNKKEGAKQYKNDYPYAKSDTSLNDMKASKVVSHNQVNTLIGEMKKLFDEMKTSRQNSQNQINTLIHEMKTSRKASQNQVNTLISEIKNSRDTSQNQVKALTDEMKNSRRASQEQISALIQIIGSESMTSRKLHDIIMNKLSDNIQIQKALINKLGHNSFIIMKNNYLFLMLNENIKNIN